MTKRKIILFTGILLLITSIMLVIYVNKGTQAQKKQSARLQFKRVSVSKAVPTDVRVRIPFTGRVIPAEKIELQAEVGGRLITGTAAFETGNRFQKGEIIFSIQDKEIRRGLRAAKHRFVARLSRILPDINIDYPDQYKVWNRYVRNVGGRHPLPPLPKVESRQFRLFLNSKGIYSTYHSIKQQEIRLSKYTVEAPFTGVVTESLLDSGDVVQPNRRLGEFTRLNPLEVEASIAAERANYAEVGERVTINNNVGANTESYTGRIIRKNARVEASTQSVQIFIRLSNTGLRPGEYVQGSLRGKTYRNAARIPGEALVRDREVFVVRDSAAVLSSIELVTQAGNSVIIRGFEPGALIITDFHDADFEGTPVLPSKSFR